MSVDTSNPAYRHGHASSAGFSPTYHSWASMVQRATNPRRTYSHRYVGRGIGIDPRWLDFDAFLADMGERPAGTTLDRVNNDKGYSKENCKWASRDEQANNKSSNRRVTLNGRTQSVTEWCRELGLSKHTVWARINKWGYTAEVALTAPLQDRAASARRMTALRVNQPRRED